MTPKKFLTTLIIFAILIIGLCTYWIVNDLQVSNRARKLDNYLDELLAEQDQEKEPRQIASDDTASHIDTSPEKPTDPHDPHDQPIDENLTREEYIQSMIEAGKPEIMIRSLITYKEGPYKGMTFADASIAWQEKEKELSDKWSTTADKIIELGDIYLANSDNHLPLLFSLLKNMSPKEVTTGKKQLLSLYPDKADEIESFFDNIKNSENLSAQEIMKKADFIREADRLNKIAHTQSHADYDKIWEELQQHRKLKPKLPPLP